jgi:hypothetical protein
VVGAAAGVYAVKRLQEKRAEAGALELYSDLAGREDPGSITRQIPPPPPGARARCRRHRHCHWEFDASMQSLEGLLSSAPTQPVCARVTAVKRGWRAAGVCPCYVCKTGLEGGALTPGASCVAPGRRWRPSAPGTASTWPRR